MDWGFGVHEEGDFPLLGLDRILLREGGNYVWFSLSHCRGGGIV